MNTKKFIHIIYIQNVHTYHQDVQKTMIHTCLLKVHCYGHALLILINLFIRENVNSI